MVVFWEVTPCSLVDRYTCTASIFMAKLSRTWKDVLCKEREPGLGVLGYTKCLPVRICIYRYVYIYGEALSSATWTPDVKLAGQMLNISGQALYRIPGR
jgi:hypothetical protein